MQYYGFVLLFLFFSGSWLPTGSAQDIDALFEKLKNSEKQEKLATLHELTSAYRNTTLDSSFIFARQAIQLSQSLGNDSLVADAHLRLCPSFHFSGLSDSVIFHATIAQDIGKKIQSSELLAYAYQLMGAAYSSMANFEKAITYNQESLSIYTKLNDQKGMGSVLQNISNVYVKTGQLDLALEHAIQSEKIATQTQRTTTRGLAALTIADIYRRLEKTEKQLSYLAKAKTLFSRDSFPSRHANVLDRIGNQHLQLQQLDSSIYYFSQSLAILESLGHGIGIATAHGNLGSIYQEAKNWKKSYFHLHKGLWMKQQLNNTYGIAFDLFNLGSHFDLQNKRDSAAYYYEASLKLATDNNIAYVKEVALQQLTDFHERAGQHQQALAYHRQYQAVLDETKNLAIEKKIASLEAKYESEKKEIEIERLALVTETQEAKNKTLSVGILSLFFISALIIGGILYRRRNERKLTLLQQKLHEKEKQELDQELQYKNKQLTSHALHMVQKNKVLQEIKQEITALSSTTDTKSKKALGGLIRRIDFNIQSDEDWNTFKLYFEQTNQDFYTNLNKINSKLTNTELKLCSLIKLNMNIKETASVLNIEPTSVKTARHRLRKKLNLEQGQDLTSFIRQVA